MTEKPPTTDDDTRTAQMSGALPAETSTHPGDPGRTLDEVDTDYHEADEAEQGPDVTVVLGFLREPLESADFWEDEFDAEEDELVDDDEGDDPFDSELDDTRTTTPSTANRRTRTTTSSTTTRTTNGSMKSSTTTWTSTSFPTKQAGRAEARRTLLSTTTPAGTEPRAEPQHTDSLRGPTSVPC